MLKTLIYSIVWAAFFALITFSWVTPPNSGYNELHATPIILGAFASAISFAALFGVLETAYKLRLYKDNYLLACGVVFVLTALTYLIYV